MPADPSGLPRRPVVQGLRMSDIEAAPWNNLDRPRVARPGWSRTWIDRCQLRCLLCSDKTRSHHKFLPPIRLRPSLTSGVRERTKGPVARPLRQRRAPAVMPGRGEFPRTISNRSRAGANGPGDRRSAARGTCGARGRGASRPDRSRARAGRGIAGRRWGRPVRCRSAAPRQGR